MYEHQLTALDLSLGEVQDWSGGGALQGKVSITGGHDDELQALGGGVAVGSAEVITGDFGHRVHPHLTGQKSNFVFKSAGFYFIFSERVQNYFLGIPTC